MAKWRHRACSAICRWNSGFLRIILYVSFGVIVDLSLAELDGHFRRIYSHFGCPSVPPEHLLRALLLQVFFSIRPERQLMEQMDYNLLFRWFVGLG